eukprot:6205066-Pleurochrysis_carterae.AAC.1
MDYVVYRLPHLGVNCRLDSKKRIAQLCLERGEVRSVCAIAYASAVCLITVHLVLKAAKLDPTSHRHRLVRGEQNGRYDPTLLQASRTPDAPAG